MFLQPADLRVLDGARINPRRSFGGRVRGERSTKKKGISIEFADYRDYSEGDDLRHLDWNVLARLDTPVMRTYRDEEDLAVYLIVDASASMQFGEPTKAERAFGMAVALGYAALNGGDAVMPVSLGAREAKRAALRSRASFPKLMRWQPQSPNETASKGLTAFATSSSRPGVVVICSDGLDPDLLPALRMIAGRGHEIFFMQVLDTMEIDPDIEGDVRLLDSEVERPVEITANGMAIKEYKRNLEAHCSGIENTVMKLGGKYALISSELGLREIAKNVWRREGWIK